MGASGGAARTTLLLSDGARVLLEQVAVSASLEHRLSERLTLVGAGGALLVGQLGGVPMSPGGVGSLGLSWLLLEQGTWSPFVQLAGTVAVSATRVAETPYLALDLRAAVSAGWTLWGRFSPYAVARAFGGPVFYGGRLGTDAYHVQLGAGFVVGLPLGLDLFAEVIPLGEQRVSAGLGVSF